MQLGSMFICNCNKALHVSDTFCLHLQEHLEIVEAASVEWHAARYKANINRSIYRLILTYIHCISLHCFWYSPITINVALYYVVTYPVTQHNLYILLFMLALYLAACHSPEAASAISKCYWRWTQKASETCRAILQLQINILPSCFTLVLLYILTYDARKRKHESPV